MNSNSLKLLIPWGIIYILTLIMLVNCSAKRHSSAPISKLRDVHDPINFPASINELEKNISMPFSSDNISFSEKKDETSYSTYRPVYQKEVEIPKINSDGRIIYSRNYDNIQKGSYSGNTYIVKRGDTLFYIAWITGNNYYDLAKRNGIKEPYNLSVGQVLNIEINKGSFDSEMLFSNSFQNKNLNTYSSNLDIESVNKRGLGKIFLKKNKALTSSTSSITTPSSVRDQTSIANTMRWYWPAKGEVIESFSELKGGNKGIDIAGLRGQPIFATAKGRVVYSGNALRGYGNLIIIKHDNDYLSAYAHNDVVLVRDQQEVYAGQKIATMGSTGTSSVKLHFEIRYKGKSVNPLHYILK